MTEFIQSFGVFAPIIYVLMFALLPVFFFPVPILAVAGGVAFGFVEGSLLTFLGASISFIVTLLMSQWSLGYLDYRVPFDIELRSGYLDKNNDEKYSINKIEEIPKFQY